MAINEQVIKVRESLKNHPEVRVVAAAKYFNLDKTKELIDAGILELGENRKEMFMEKYEAFKDYPITWHYFGIIKIPPKLNSTFVDAIDYLHSLDSIDLANAINKTRKRKEPLKCFVQVNIAGIPKQSGLDESRVIPFIKSLAKYDKIEVVGLMTTGRYTFDEEAIKGYFSAMQELQKEVQELKLPHAPCTELSMGMSNDYKIAIDYGSTFVRLGQIFSR